MSSYKLQAKNKKTGEVVEYTLFPNGMYNTSDNLYRKLFSKDEFNELYEAVEGKVSVMSQWNEEVVKNTFLGELTTSEEKCDCEEMSCKEGCTRKHTHKTFYCKKCGFDVTDLEGDITTKIKFEVVEEKIKPIIGYDDTYNSDIKRAVENQLKEETPEWEVQFEELFGDPMTKKYGEGYVLYCSACNGKRNGEVKQFIKKTLEKEKERIVREIEDEEVGIMDEVDLGFNQGLKKAIKLIQNK